MQSVQLDKEPQSYSLLHGLIALTTIIGGLVAHYWVGLGFWGVLMVIGALYGGLYLYGLPVIIAEKRSHPQTLAISLLTIFAGWTAILWLVALIWALSAPEVRRSAPQQAS